MSVVWLKNRLFPNLRAQPNQPQATIAHESKDLPMAVTDMNTGPPPLSSAVSDIETQQTDSDHSFYGKRYPFWRLLVSYLCFSPSWKGMRARMISDATIGLADGLTVPFALTAGLSSLGSTKVVILGGLAELLAGMISMGLGGYFGAISEAASYKATVKSTTKLIKDSPSDTHVMIHDVFAPYGIPQDSVIVISETLHTSSTNLLDFLMKFYHQSPKPEGSRPLISAITIGGSYFLGGLVPLIPYFAVPKDKVLLGLWWSIGVMAFALFIFGWVKTGIVSGWRGKHNVRNGLLGALQMICVGGAAAGCSVLIVRGINSILG